MTLLTGVDRLFQQDENPLAGKRVALMTNPSGVTRGLIPTIDLFRARHGTAFTLAAIFTAEHGFTAAGKDGEAVASSTDPISGAPIYSLYGETYAPTPAMLDHLDMIVCDIQDIGVRYYTFAWTITHILEAAGAAGIPVMILDRPNPLGDAVDGPLLDRRFASLVGRVPVPVQHGLTLGELMQMFNARWNPTPAQISVIPCEGLQRDTSWEQTGLAFVPPSPGMPHLSTVRQYPGACLVEGTNLSEGRGTPLPFEIVGAPFIDENQLAERLNALAIPGVIYRSHVFQPTSSKFSGEVCRGIQAHSVSPAYRPLLAWLRVIQTVHNLYPADFAWREASFDRLYGSDAGRACIESGRPVAELVAAWDADSRVFREQCAPYLLYTGG
ncbi:MAG: DUF1343 domain-containing protein [Anaerolineaceae bacterium]|nr:DUF1343 domain-containing protein [Anaerolineaceae bacterium]